MQNLNFDDGYIELQLNNNPDNVIKINPSDVSIVARIIESYKRIEDATKDISDIKLKPNGTPLKEYETEVAVVEKIGQIVKDAIDEVFNSNVSYIVFGKQSPFSYVGNGKFLWESFLEAIIKYMQEETKKRNEESKKRINKYVSVVK